LIVLQDEKLTPATTFRRRERLERMLEIANAVVDADVTDADDLAILQAAIDQAQVRVSYGCFSWFNGTPP
jgi:hypothetical protein